MPGINIERINNYKELLQIKICRQLIPMIRTLPNQLKFRLQSNLTKMALLLTNNTLALPNHFLFLFKYFALNS
jgi:hypothetical protein